MEKKLDFTAAWNDALALLKANLETILPIVGVFILLPSIIVGYMVPEPVMDPAAADSGMSQLWQYYGDLGPWLLLTTVASVIAYATIYSLVFNPSRPTVGEAFSIALTFFVPLLIATILSTVAMMIGMIFLIIPGIYLLIKFSLSGPAIVAENIKNPIAAMSRSWALTKGNSLYIFAFVLIVGIVGFIAVYLSTMIFSAIFGMILPASGAAFGSLIVRSIFSAVFSAVSLFVIIAIYRQLSASN
jgi:hypothetical protein